MTHILHATCLDTKLGSMIAISDMEKLYVLDFIERSDLEHEISRLGKKLKSKIILGETTITKNIKAELANYFAGKKIVFETPIHLIGTPFQKTVWNELKNIPYGSTRSYLYMARAIKKPTAYRAVAQANGANPLTIIIPCHRVINENGNLGGYGGGIERKKWLLEHEGI